MRKVRLTTAILAMGLSAGFLSARGVASARTISHRVPAQSSGRSRKTWAASKIRRLPRRGALTGSPFCCKRLAKQSVDIS